MKVNVIHHMKMKTYNENSKKEKVYYYLKWHRESIWQSPTLIPDKDSLYARNRSELPQPNNEYLPKPYRTVFWEKDTTLLLKSGRRQMSALTTSIQTELEVLLSRLTHTKVKSLSMERNTLCLFTCNVIIYVENLMEFIIQKGH